MVEVSTSGGRYGIAVTCISFGGLFILTIVGAPLGIGLIVAGLAVAVHTWWKDFDDEADEADAEAA